MLRKAKHLFRKDQFVKVELVDTRDKVQTDDPVEMFKQSFIRSFLVFKVEAQILAKGDTHIKDTWVDIAGKEGLAINVVVITGIIAILGAVGIFSMVATAGAAIPIAVAGVVGGVLFYNYRSRVKLEQYRHAVALMDREDFNVSVENMANTLADLYRMQLNTLTLKDADKFGKECVDVLAEQLLKNKKFNFNELLYPASLQATFTKKLSNVSKIKMDRNINSERQFNMRGMMGHSAFYCKDTAEFYQTSGSKPQKYGVLLFDKKSDLEDYADITKCEIQRMRHHEENLLRRSSIFRALKNDEIFNDDVVFISRKSN